MVSSFLIMFVRPLLIGTSVASYFKYLFLGNHLMCANVIIFTAPYKMGIHQFLGKVKAGAKTGGVLHVNM